MSPTVYPIFAYLAKLPVTLHLPFNAWTWLLFAAAPALVFFVSIQRSVLSHMLRVVGAIALTYVLLNLSLHADKAFDRRDFESCQEQSVHRDRSPEMHQECGHHVNTADGAHLAFTYLYGWIPAAAYVGLWEAIWRVRNRKRIKEMGAAYHGKWVSGATMSLMALPILFYAFIGSFYRLFVS